ncbi:hypothetical protein LIER_03787 [Lithospermum erythrorhizon]|uniref:Uncharacterized protein n=1 Tax=Lithospermum erythrorhizon TaxID=34254 RepID=A0AAV3NUJ5_LITER
MLFSYQSFIISIIFPLCTYSVSCCDSCSWHSHQHVQHLDRKFEQKTNTFWEFEDQSNTWIQVKLPYDLVSCTNDDCTKVGSIINKVTTTQNSKQESNDSHEVFLPLKKKIGSLRIMSETSIWITGQSGSIYERFWNGLLWVTAPHELPIAAGPAISVFMVNHTILALSQAGNLYQMRLNEDSQAEWIDLKPILNPRIDDQTEQSSALKLTSGVITHDKERIYFCSKSGSLLELSETDPVRWINHGRPSGADVAIIADAEIFKPTVIFTISSEGHLYEYDKSAKTPWKKHIQKEGSTESTSLATSTGCTLLSTSRTHWISLFLLTKGGDLVERRLHQRKWKWLVHGKPDKYPLTSITCTTQDVLTEYSNFLFLTTASGYIYEYRISKESGLERENEDLETWENHKHPPFAKVAIGIPGIQLQVGRMMFLLNDGRVAELHVQGLGGETSPINQKFNTRRKTGFKFVWSILDAPESEGWNAEYCTGERGPLNCITGTKEEYVELDDERSLSISKRRRIGINAEQNYLPISSTSEILSSISSEEYSSPFPDNNWINTNFRLRQMHGGKSVFVVSDDGMLYEFLSNDNLQLWLRNDEQSTAVRGIVGSYNGTLYVVDEHGSLLLIKDRSIDENMAWINCTAMKKGRKVISGPPWNGVSTTATPQDALFFVSTTGKLLQLTVALGNFKWKNCKNPQIVRIACIVDQEEFRRNIVIVVGKNGRLYQYNKITELWHEHYQSKHLSLSRVPGTTMRPSSSLTKGSIFMTSVDGGLVQYKFDSVDGGWKWIEHGTPSTSVILAGSPGPCFSGLQLFVIGSDGGVYLRYYDDQAIWRWKNLAFPYTEGNVDNGIDQESGTLTEAERLQRQQHTDENCDRKVESTRPIPVTEDSVIFQLRDSRLAEMGKNGEGNWIWKRTIATPNSKCLDHLWTTLAS